MNLIRPNGNSYPDTRYTSVFLQDDGNGIKKKKGEIFIISFFSFGLSSNYVKIINIIIFVLVNLSLLFINVQEFASCPIYKKNCLTNSECDQNN